MGESVTSLRETVCGIVNTLVERMMELESIREKLSLMMQSLLQERRE